ncbi:unnamed protein product [Microthlaspi erraticum]|uniref:TFIIS N-terminal domain-containing protein n=1 Tax=Microthlaspi erraticum TaxID=1685480 RepID=A0A6D2K9A8_9BRAS|nr:unnamed protein product [Microthlaspi erraticum]
MRVRIAKERSDLTELVSAAIKTTYDTRSPGGVERCIDALNQLKSLSLSVEDLQWSESIVSLETLRRHRSPKIRKEAQSLFDSWSNTLYARGRDNTSIAGLMKSCLKHKKSVLKRCSELLKKKEEEISNLTHEAKEIKKETGFLESKKKTDKRSEKINKETKTNFLESKKKEDQKSLPCEAIEIEKETKTNLRKKSDDRKAIGSLEVAGNQKMCPVTATSLTQHSRENIKDKDGQVTTKTLIPPPRRTKKQQTGPAKNSENPKSPALKTKTEEALKKKKTDVALEKKKTEIVELFEAAMKAADVAYSRSVLSGTPEVSRCVEALSLLMDSNISPNPKEPRRMMERLEGLTKHKYHKICNAASSLLHLWRQRIRKQERKDSAAKKTTFRNNSFSFNKSLPLPDLNLGVSRWSVWKTEKYMQSLAGDLVRYPKWLETDLFFNGPYRERYCFKAYGDD